MARQLEDDIKFINEAREISLNWEIHSRIAQAINDTCIRKVPQQQYRDLKAAGHGYLPPLLTAWAFDLDSIPTALANEIGDNERDQYRAKINRLWREDLIDDVAPIWHAVPVAARNLMITMWIKRDPSRSGITHPVPSVILARNLIWLDQDLTLAEIDLAEGVIPVAVGKNGNRLFNDDSSGNF